MYDNGGNDLQDPQIFLEKERPFSVFNHLDKYMQPYVDYINGLIAKIVSKMLLARKEKRCKLPKKDIIGS